MKCRELKRFSRRCFGLIDRCIGVRFSIVVSMDGEGSSGYGAGYCTDGIVLEIELVTVRFQCCVIL